jgi:hypothetical protein
MAINEHDIEECERELTSHGYTPCRCDERAEYRKLAMRVDDAQHERELLRVKEAKARLAAHGAECKVRDMKTSLRALVEAWRAEIKERAGSGCGCYGKSTMQRACAAELWATIEDIADG